MSSSGNRRDRAKNTATSREMDEVEQLLQAAQDDLLLKLSVDSHIARGGASCGFSNSDHLDSDLTSRFQALRSSRPSAPSLQSRPKPSPQNQISSSPLPPPALPSQIDEELKNVLGDDLSARFARLKGSMNASSSPSVSSTVLFHLGLSGPSDCPGYRDGADLNLNEEDEVDKIIQWAKDAARLDPSPPTDDEADDTDSDLETSTDGDGDDYVEQKKKRKNTVRGRKNK